MSRLDDLIEQKELELNYLKSLREIINSHDCNECADSKDCGYRPEWGELIRYNCPLFVKRDEEDE